MLPQWVHWMIIGVPSFTGAALGVFLPAGRSRYLLGWLGAALGVFIGLIAVINIDPPLVVDPALVVINGSIGSALYGLVPYILVLSFWAFLQWRSSRRQSRTIRS